MWPPQCGIATSICDLPITTIYIRVLSVFFILRFALLRFLTVIPWLISEIIEQISVYLIQFISSISIFFFRSVVRLVFLLLKKNTVCVCVRVFCGFFLIHLIGAKALHSLTRSLAQSVAPLLTHNQNPIRL